MASTTDEAADQAAVQALLQSATPATAAWVRFVDIMWGPDVGWQRSSGRLFLKILFSAVIAYGAHQLSVWRAFNPDPIEEMEKEINDRLADEQNKPSSPNKIDLRIKILAKTTGGLSYILCKPNDRPCSLSIQSNDFYAVESELWVSHPKVKDSTHVFLRRIEGAWKGNDTEGETRLCSESRRTLDPKFCGVTEKFRRNIEGLENQPKAKLIKHLDAVQKWAMLFGLIQCATLAVFIFLLVEAAGLTARWLRAPSFVEEYVARGILDRLKEGDKHNFEARLEVASRARVRAFVDRFLEKALSKSATPAEIRLRNFRDMLMDDCMSRLDVLEMLGDTMLKISFLGTVFGIGRALFEARDLDAAEPLIRLGAKSEMYAGIGMGFGATMVGILLSIIAAKLRSALSGAWTSAIDRAWREASVFYDLNYGSGEFPAVPGVNPIPTPYERLTEFKRREADGNGDAEPVKRASFPERFVDALLTYLGIAAIAAVVIALGVWWFGGGMR